MLKTTPRSSLPYRFGLLVMFLVCNGLCTLLSTDSLILGGPLDFSSGKYPAEEENPFSLMPKAPGGDSILVKMLTVLNQGGYDTAAAMAKRYLDRNPKSVAALEILGSALAMKGSLDEGMAVLQKAVSINPAECSAITKIGDIYLAKKKEAAARKEFLKAVECSPSEYRAHQRLGILYEKEKNYPLAIEHFEKGIIGTAPQYVGIKVNLANPTCSTDSNPFCGRWAYAIH